MQNFFYCSAYMFQSLFFSVVKYLGSIKDRLQLVKKKCITGYIEDEESAGYATIRQTPWPCDVCGLVFDNDAQLQRHLMSQLHQEKEEHDAKQEWLYRHPPAGVATAEDYQICTE